MTKLSLQKRTFVDGILEGAIYIQQGETEKLLCECNIELGAHQFAFGNGSAPIEWNNPTSQISC